MDEDAAFIRAILATPDDAELRLVYADWLEGRGDPRGEYLRLIHEHDALAGAEPRSSTLGLRIRELIGRLDLRWIASMNRGRVRPAPSRGQGDGPARRLGSDRRMALEADVGLFLRQYGRKRRIGYDPNDRAYCREFEAVVKRMDPEALDRLIRGDGIESDDPARSDPGGRPALHS